MKNANTQTGVLIAVLVVAAIGAIFMFSSSTEPAGLASYNDDPQFTQEQSNCLMGCYQDLQDESYNNDILSRQRLASCLRYCQKLPK